MILEGIILIITIILLQHLIGRLREPSNLPPGPPPLPLIGNIYNVISSMPQMHRAFSALAKKYGNLFTVYLQGYRVVVINSVQSAREAMMSKKDDFSGRPVTFTGNIFSRGSKGIGFTDFNPTLVLQRKLTHSALRMYAPKLEEKVTMEIEELIKRFVKLFKSVYPVLRRLGRLFIVSSTITVLAGGLIPGLRIRGTRLFIIATTFTVLVLAGSWIPV